jgi:hypothetical protein
MTIHLQLDLARADFEVSVDVQLPAHGITGNSHMIMMDRNSDQVAALVQGWLAARGLWA